MPVRAQLGQILGSIVSHFPKLQILSLPTFAECMPTLSESSSFIHLRSFIFDGSSSIVAGKNPSISLILSFLQHIPHLENMWMKHPINPDPEAHPFGKTSSEITNRKDSEPPIVLRYLTRLALMVPGACSAILSCIEAPALCDLHLHGTLVPSFYEGGDPIWPCWSNRVVMNALKAFAWRPSSLHRLAITELYFANKELDWLLFGDGRGAPFPQLESLALHYSSFGFSDRFLLRCSQQQTAVSLRRLALLNCSSPRLTSSAIVCAITSPFNGLRKAGGFELELDDTAPQFTENELGALAAIGVKLIRWSDGERWKSGGQKLHDWIDPCDSYAY